MPVKIRLFSYPTDDCKMKKNAYRSDALLIIFTAHEFLKKLFHACFCLLVCVYFACVFFRIIILERLKAKNRIHEKSTKKSLKDKKRLLETIKPFKSLNSEHR